MVKVLNWNAVDITIDFERVSGYIGFRLNNHLE